MTVTDDEVSLSSQKQAQARMMSSVEFNLGGRRAVLNLALRAVRKMREQWRIGDVQLLRSDIQEYSPIVAGVTIWNQIYQEKRSGYADENECRHIEDTLSAVIETIERVLRDNTSQVEFPREVDLSRPADAFKHWSLRSAQSGLFI